MANNKLLLIHDVDELGRSGDIVSVKPGYARNFLLPQGLAIVADKNALKMQDRLQEERKKRAMEDKKEAEGVALSLSDLTVSTHVKVDHDGHMYGSVSSTDIATLIQDQHGITLEKKNIQLKHPIKEVGGFDISIKLKEGVMCKVHLEVIAEEHQTH